MSVTILRPSIFSLFPDIIAGVSTRQGGVSPAPLGLNTGRQDVDTRENIAENRRRMCEAMGIDVARLATQHQVHGAHSTIVDAPCALDANDALLTHSTNVFLAVSVADCQPVLLYDRAQRIVAGIHAGWRGAAAHIVDATLRRMMREFGTDPAEVYAYVGPCASACCYEVDAAVASHFAPAHSTPHGDGHAMLDLKRASFDELRACGVPASHIEISSCCTICMPEFFHSHRRDGAGAGRMMAVIGMRGHDDRG